jgi:hypothetical protein
MNLSVRKQQDAEQATQALMTIIVCTPSPDIVLVVESWRVRLVGRVWLRAEVRKAYQIFVGKPERKKPSLNIGVDGNVISN